MREMQFNLIEVREWFLRSREQVGYMIMKLRREIAALCTQYTPGSSNVIGIAFIIILNRI